RAVHVRLRPARAGLAGHPGSRGHAGGEAVLEDAAARRRPAVPGPRLSLCQSWCVTTIGFLHTGDVHVATFRRLREELAPGWQDLHIVDPALLADARREGITAELAGR